MEFITDTNIADIILIKPTIFSDNRGYFFESYHHEKFMAAGITDTFLQDNQSHSVKGTLRGLHLQREPKGQAKCIRCLRGSIYDVAVDVRPHSSTFGNWTAYTLSADNQHMLYIPSGFAHGFLVLSDIATIQYKCSHTYSKEHEQCLRYDDPDVAIDWPEHQAIILSEKDQQGLSLGSFQKT